MRVRTRLVAICATVTVVVVLLAGCSIPQSDTDYLRVFSTEPEVGLVSTNTNEISGGRIIDMLFTGLYDYDINGNSVPAMVDTLTTTDNTNYTITIKRGWKFTDGTEVLARNFVDAWNYGAYTPNAQRQQSFFASILGYDEVSGETPSAKTMRGLRVVDDHTFTVALKQPTIDFEKSLGFTPFKPLPDVAFRDMDAFGQHPVGNGPYQFKTWRHNIQVDVVPNPLYPGANKPKNKGLSFVIYTEAETAYTDLLSGNLDESDPLPPSALRTYRKELGDRALTRPTAQQSWISIPYRAQHFSGEEGRLRRQAISRAINREQIAKNIFLGTRIPASDFTAQTLPGYRADIPGSENTEYNPAAAKELWAQANKIAPWTGSFVISSNYDAGNKEWIEATANSIKNTLGIDARGKAVATFKQIRQDINAGTITTAFRSAWFADYPSMLEFLEPNWVTGAGSNDPRYSNPTFDAKIREAESAPTPEESYAKTAEAQSILLNDLPGIPMHYWVAAGGLGDGVKGQLSWNGTPDYVNMTRS